MLEADIFWPKGLDLDLKNSLIFCDKFSYLQVTGLYSLKDLGIMWFLNA